MLWRLQRPNVLLCLLAFVVSFFPFGCGGVERHWVGASDCSLTPPEEPCVRVSPHTARAFPRTARLRVVPLLDEFVASWRRIVTLSGNLAILVGGRLGCAPLATAPGRTKRLASLIICFSRLRRFHRLSCHSRPDRRGRIRCVTHRLWLLRSSQCCSCCPALRLG